MTLRDLSNTDKYPECLPSTACVPTTTCVDGNVITDASAGTCRTVQPLDAGANCQTNHLILTDTTNNDCSTGVANIKLVCKVSATGGNKGLCIADKTELTPANADIVDCTNTITAASILVPFAASLTEIQDQCTTVCGGAGDQQGWCDAEMGFGLTV